MEKSKERTQGNKKTDIRVWIKVARYFFWLYKQYMVSDFFDKSIQFGKLDWHENFLSGKPWNGRSENHLSWELQAEKMPLGLTTCSASSFSSSNSSSVSIEQLAQRFLPLMHDCVEPLFRRPIAYTNWYNLQKLTVDVCEIYTQIYTTTHSLYLLKLTVRKSESRKEPQITEVTLNFIVNLPQVGAHNFEECLFDDNFTYFVKLNHNSVYIGNTWTLYKVDKNLGVWTCSRFQRNDSVFGANFSISRTSNSTNQNPTLNLPYAR